MSSLNFVSGWFPSPPDDRDFQYAKSYPYGDLPTVVDLSTKFKGAPLDPLWNQGNLGSCGPQTSSADLLCVMFLLGQAPIMPSRLFTYYCTRDIMGTVNRDSGVYNRALVQSYLKYGWCDETLWPYDIGKYRQRPPQACYDQAAFRKIDEYVAVPQDLTVMKTAIANEDPFIFGFTVFQNFYRAASNGGLVPMPSGRVVGGHDVLIVGYDDNKELFKFRNSYSTSWGDKGYGYIPYRYALDARYTNDFWTIVGTGLPKPTPPVPPTPPGPTPPVPVPVPVKKGKVLVDLDAMTVSRYSENSQIYQTREVD